jgi:hypothetical protein
LYSIMQWERTTETWLGAVRLSAYDLALTAIPELGGKISSLQWNGREVLAHNPHKPLRRAEYAAPYADYDASGFDECFPTIGACQHPDAPDVQAPDHGELWAIPWQEGVFQNGLYLFVNGFRFPYSFHRWIEIAGMGHLRLRYEVRSSADRPYRYLWSAHPLLALRPGMGIHLPKGVRVRVDWSRDGRLGNLLDEHPWPVTTDSSGNTVDLSRILPDSAGLVDKLYTTRLQEGWCALHDPTDGYYVAMLFSPEQIPYLGLSINLGGWPVEGPGYYNLGLEPCNGYPDRLDVAIERGDCIVLEPSSSLKWEWHLFIGQTADLRSELTRLDGLL